jgi:hypothetical protein
MGFSLPLLTIRHGMNTTWLPKKKEGRSSESPISQPHRGRQGCKQEKQGNSADSKSASALVWTDYTTKNVVSATRHDFNAFVRSLVRSFVRSFVRAC